MLKSEFERGTNTVVGQDITEAEYDTIEKCYNTFDYLFNDKQDVYKMFREFGMSVFNRLSNEASIVRGLNTKNTELTKSNEDLHSKYLELLSVKSSNEIANYNVQDALTTENLYLRTQVDELNNEIEMLKQQLTKTVNSVIDSFLNKEEQ